MYRRDGKQVRPFSTAAGVKCRGYSRRLQWVVTDLGADLSFAKAAKKVKTHHQIEIPDSAVRDITLRHGKAMKEEELGSELGKRGAPCVIGEMDGFFLPIVSIKPQEQGDKSPGDGRKRRQIEWKEARLCTGRDARMVTRHYRATMGTPEQAGRLLKECVVAAGGGASSRLHFLGDGAPWIVKQIKFQFGEEAPFLLDYYHVSEYLGAVASTLADHKVWLHHQQERLKASEANTIIEELRPLEAVERRRQRRRKRRSQNPKEEIPIATCLHYLENRLPYLNYKAAIAESLPIGSGEVEGGISSVVKPRLKLSGASWLFDNAENMMALRTAFASGRSDDYWDGIRQAAA